LIRSGVMLQLTRDDTWANLESPDMPGAAEPALKNVLTKALGARDEVAFDVQHRRLEPGDLVLLGSDRLTGLLPGSRILEIVSAHGGDLRRACEELVPQANAQGGRDNISAILLRQVARA